MTDITLIPVQEHEKDEFIRALQQSFRLAVADDLDDGEEVISREEIEESMTAPKAESYHIVVDGEKAGGAVIVINAETERGSLDLLFMFPQKHGSGLGGKAWRAIERLYPEVRMWETHTPYFEKRNIHFYVNKCGFKIVEFLIRTTPIPLDRKQWGKMKRLNISSVLKKKCRNSRRMYFLVLSFSDFIY